MDVTNIWRCGTNSSNRNHAQPVRQRVGDAENLSHRSVKYKELFQERWRHRHRPGRSRWHNSPAAGPSRAITIVPDHGKFMTHSEAIDKDGRHTQDWCNADQISRDANNRRSSGSRTHNRLKVQWSERTLNVASSAHHAPLDRDWIICDLKLAPFFMVMSALTAAAVWRHRAILATAEAAHEKRTKTPSTTLSR
jgi:hypothetical protein